MADLPKVLDDNFESEVLLSDIPVLVDFSAEWCGPCKQLAPKLEELAKDYDGRVRIVTLDVDEARSTAMRFGVMSVPTIMVFKNGQRVAQQIGNTPKSTIDEMLRQAIAGE